MTAQKVASATTFNDGLARSRAELLNYHLRTVPPLVTRALQHGEEHMPAIRKHARAAGVFPGRHCDDCVGSAAVRPDTQNAVRQREQDVVGLPTHAGWDFNRRQGRDRAAANRHALQLSIEAGYEGDRLAVR